nr:hypothetical protein [Tanacetum cinerariifolium]
MGIGIPNDVVVSAARFIGCSTLSVSFTYLGVKAGRLMSRLSSWDDVIAKLSSRSLWIDIICEFRTLANKGIDLRSLVKKKVGNDELTTFWDDIWLVDSPLKALYSRLYYLDLDKQSSVATKLRDSSLTSSFRRPPHGGIEKEQLKLLIESTSFIVLPQISDRWIWRLDSSREFSVKLARCFIDDSLLPKVGVPTRWVNAIPIKINIFA